MNRTIGHKLGKFPDTRTVKQPTLEMALPNSFLGIEIELENLGSLGYPSEQPTPLGKGWWSYIKEGSLRNNGGEFVLSYPLAGDDIIKALDDFLLIINNITPAASHRTSVHLHIDVRDMTNEQLLSMLLLSIVFERTLFKFSGNRDSNNYCLPFFRSNSLLKDLLNLRKVESAYDFSELYDNENLKYTGINILPIGQQGSVEYRQMEGSYNVNRLYNWINIIFCLKRAGMEYGHNIEKVFQELGSYSANKLTKTIFKEYAEQVLPYVKSSDIMWGKRLALDVINHNKTSDAAKEIHNRFFFIEEGDLMRDYLLLNNTKKLSMPPTEFEVIINDDDEEEDYEEIS